MNYLKTQLISLLLVGSLLPALYCKADQRSWSNSPECKNDADCVSVLDTKGSGFHKDSSGKPGVIACPVIHRSNVSIYEDTDFEVSQPCEPSEAVRCINKSCTAAKKTIAGFEHDNDDRPMVKKPAIYIYPSGEPGMERKPAVYLYTNQPMDVTIELSDNITPTFVYPPFSESLKGWKVKALTNGRLLDQTGREFEYLFWEGNLKQPPLFSREEGYVVESRNLTEFFERELTNIGLNIRERNEFIIYWVPILQRTPWNYIHFLTDEYLKAAPLTVTPKPQNVLQLFMTYAPLDAPINVTPQRFPKFERNGLTVVEWGGGLMEGAL